MMTWALLFLDTIPAVLAPAVLALVVGLTTAGRTRRLAVTGLVMAAAGVLVSEVVHALRRPTLQAVGSFQGVGDTLDLVTQSVSVITALVAGVLVLLAVGRDRTTAQGKSR